ncbi:MAG: hypothetical protein QGH83_09420 [Candidatus Pacebacteria bacterium]|jgi:hypothetical protein|nr:hypothetical protein [Candidatus Paceibacterota bacterium]
MPVINLKGKVRSQKEIVAQTVKISSGDVSLGDLSDVDTAGQTDGAMMIFDGISGNYEMKTQIENENLNIIGGTY